MVPLTLTCHVVSNASLCGMASAVGWEEIGSPILEVGVATEMELEVKRGCDILEHCLDPTEISETLGKSIIL